MENKLKEKINFVNMVLAIVKIQVFDCDPGRILRQGVQGVGPVVSRLIGIGRETAVGVPNQPGQVAAPEFGAIVGVEQKAVLICFHLVGGVAGL